MYKAYTYFKKKNWEWLFQEKPRLDLIKMYYICKIGNSTLEVG